MMARPFHPAAVVVAFATAFCAACDEDRRLVPTNPSGTAGAPIDVPAPPPPSPVPPARGSTGRIAFVSDRDGADAIYLANPDGSGVIRLTVGHEPAWAPGGRQLTFQRNGSIYTINLDGSRESRVTGGGHPEWSPDGLKLVYTMDGSIRTINTDGSGGRRVFDATSWNTAYAEYRAGWPSWSPDGRTIAFVRTAGWDDAWALFIVDADGTTQPRLLVEGTAENTSWSPDGSRIAYAAGGPHQFTAVRTVLANGGAPMFVGEGFWPDWTPTGQLIFEAFALDGRPSMGCCGKGSRIFTSSSDRPLIPEANAPARADYSDRQPVWSR